MGTHMGPSYACLFVGCAKQSLFDPTTWNIFHAPPLSAFRKDHSLHYSLVRTTLLTNHSNLPGAFPCNHTRCNTCPQTTSLTSIQGPKQSFQ
eukprot:g20863.t1